MLFLLTDGDIAPWAAQDEPELLKAQECAFDYDTHTLAAIDEQVTEQARVDTTPRRRRWRQKQNVEAAANRGGVLFLV